jgi:hypothetical protein
VFPAAPWFVLCSSFPSNADGSSLSRGDWYGSPLTRTASGLGALAASRVRPPLPHSSSSSPPLPLLSSSRGGEPRKGKTPMWLGVREGLGLRVVCARVKDATKLQDWAPGRDWRRGRLPMTATVPTASPAGAKGGFPLAESPGVGHGCARELGVRASSAARPSHPRACGRDAS